MRFEALFEKKMFTKKMRFFGARSPFEIFKGQSAKNGYLKTVLRGTF